MDAIMKSINETHPSLCKEFDLSASGNKYYRNIGSCLTSEAIPFERDGKPNVIDDAFGYRIPYVLCEDVQKHTIDKDILLDKLIDLRPNDGEVGEFSIVADGKLELINEIIKYFELEDTVNCIDKDE